MTVSLKKSGRYRWFIAASGFCLMAFSIGIISNCFSLFTIPVTESLGFTRKEFGINQTLMFAAMMLATPQVGRFIRKAGVIREIRIVTVILAVTYSGYALASKLWQFYCISVMLGILMPFVTTVPLSILINQWFRKEQGLALGITFMGSGIGGTVFNPVSNIIIQKWGWRAAYGSVAVIMLIVLVPITCLVLREVPREWKHNQNETDVNTGTGLTGMKFKTVLKSWQYRAYLFLGVLMGAGTYSVINFTSTYLQDAGYSSYFATTVAAFSMGGMAAGKLLLGWLYDLFGIRRSTLLAVLFLGIGIAGSCLAEWQAAAGLIILGSSIGGPIGTIGPPLLIRQGFGSRDYSDKLSLMVACGNLGAAVMPSLAGIIYEHTGSYEGMYWLLLGLVAAAFAGFAVVLPESAGQY